MRKPPSTASQVVTSALLWALFASLSPGQSFYKEPYGLFSTRPDEKKSLQNITNYFIVSLAVADLCVAGVVMPFYAYTMVRKNFR